MDVMQQGPRVSRQGLQPVSDKHEEQIIAVPSSFIADLKPNLSKYLSELWRVGMGPPAPHLNKPVRILAVGVGRVFSTIGCIIYVLFPKPDDCISYSRSITEGSRLISRLHTGTRVRIALILKGRAAACMRFT